MRKVQEETGLKVKTLEDEPTLGRHLNWIWQAFTDLNYRRPVGFSGPCPFNYSDIEAYCRLKGIYALGERERLLRYIDLLDREYMANHYAEAEKKVEAKGTKDITPQAPRQRGARKPPRKVVS